MNAEMENPQREPSDGLLDEVRRIRRAVCEASGHDVDRLCAQLKDVERQYDARQGLYAGVTAERAAGVVAGWGAEARLGDNPIIDEVRAIRQKLERQRRAATTMDGVTDRARVE